MKMLILGATGGTGRCLLSAALASGDQVTALARNPAALADVADRVTVIKGDATSRADAASAIEGQDAVVSALGTGRSLAARKLFSLAASAVTGAAADHGAVRLVWMSSFGVGDTLAQAPLPLQLPYRTLLREVFADKKAADDLIRASGLDWTVAYPVTLTNGPATGSYRTGERLALKGMPKVSRADVADFLVKAAHGSEWSRRNVVISY